VGSSRKFNLCYSALPGSHDLARLFRRFDNQFDLRYRLLRHWILYRVQAAFLAFACLVFGDGSNIDLLDKRQPLNKYPYADLANRRDKALADGEVMKRGAFPQKGVGGGCPCLAGTRIPHQFSYLQALMNLAGKEGQRDNRRVLTFAPSGFDLCLEVNGKLSRSGLIKGLGPPKCLIKNSKLILPPFGFACDRANFSAVV